MQGFYFKTINFIIMNRISKFLSSSMLVFITCMTLVFARQAGVTCTLVFGVVSYGYHAEYWCCSGSQGCFWDFYYVNVP
jgi:hypothetical protein